MKRQINKVKKSANWAKKEVLDKRILDLASKRYQHLQKKLVESATRLGEDHELVARLGDHILQKAKSVRASLKKTRGTPKTK